MKLKLRKEKNINKFKSPNYAHLAGRAFGDLNSFFSPMFFLSLVLMLGIGQKGFGNNLKVKETNPTSQNEIANETINASNETENLIEGEEANSNQNLIYIDSELENPEVLLDAVIENYNEKTLFIFSHGKPGQLLIDGDWLTAKELVDWIPEQEEFSGFENIQIYGCEFGKGEIGEKAVSYLTSNLGVSISASNDLTGIDGNWDLEVGSNPKVDIVPDYDFNLQVSYLKEAENYTTIVNESGGDYWSTETDGSETVIQALDNDGSLFNNKTGASVSYAFPISNSDNYYIHIRAKAGSGGGSDDSYHWDLNDGGLTTENNNLNNSFQWRTYGTNSLNAGTNILNIYEREDGVIIDKVMLSTESSPTTALNYVVAAPAAPPSSNCVELELATDGQFNNGNTLNSYSSDLPTNWSNGNHAISKNPINTWSWAPSFTDHTGNNGYMLIADGANYSGHRVWYNTYYIPQGTTVTLSVWVRDFWGGNDAAKLYWGVNGVQTGAVVTAVQGVWTLLSTTYTTATTGNVTFGIHNQQTSGNGNDFAIDDVSVIKCVEPTCSGNFYDTGGSSGNYSNNENYYRTYCAPYGQNIRLSFTQFSIENNYDKLYIYDGEDISAGLIGTYTGNNGPGTRTSTNNCLTIRFTSDYSVNGQGWAAGISCVTDPACPSINQILIKTLSGGSDIDITGGATLYTGQLPTNWNIEGTATGSIGSMKFNVTGGATQSNIENSSPYRMPSDAGNLNWGAGTYNLTTTIYSGSNGSGKVCDVENTPLIIESCSIVNLTASSNSPVCVGQTLNLTSNGGGVGATYAWTGPNGFTSNAQNPVISNATLARSGNYQLTVTNAGCSATASTSVTINEIPSVTLTSANANCGLNNGSITFNFTDVSGRTNIEFSTNNGSTYPTNVLDNSGSTTVTGLGPATYQVWTRWQGGNCPVSLGNVVIIRKSGTLTSSPNATICSGNSTNLTTSLNNGVGTVTYSWSNGLGSGSSKTVSPASNITYSITGTDSQGCTATSTISVTVNSLPTITAGSNSPVCSGGSINLTSGGGTSYVWSGPNSFSSSSQNPNISSAASAMAGIYNVTGTNSNGCSATAAVNVTITSGATVTATSSDNKVCDGMAINLQSSGANTYVWEGPGGFTSNAQNPNITSALSSNNGVYKVTGTTSAGCTASATTSVNVVVNNPTASNDGAKCQGSTINFTSSSATANSTSWAGPNGFSSNSPNASIANAALSFEGVYTVTITATDACTRTATTELTLYSLPNVSITDPGTICRGDNMNLTASGGTGYSWSGPNFFSSNLQNPVVTNMQANKTGIYTVIVTNAQNCSASATTEASLSFPSLAVSGDTAICETGTINLMASGGVSYAWVGPNSYTSTSDSNAIVNAAKINEGTYTVTVSNSLGCSAAQDVKVTVLSTTSPIISNTPVCTGDTLKMKNPGWSTYAWTGPNGFSSNLKEPFIASATIANSGTYSVTLSVAGCTTSATKLLTVNPLPVPVLNSNQPVCIGGNLNLTSSASSLYAWKGPASFTSTSQNPIRAVSDSLVQGVYTLIQTNSFGCVDSSTHMVDVSVVHPSAVNSGTACVGSTVTLSAFGGSTYSWNGPNGFTSGSKNASVLNITTAFNGVYTATVTDANSCSSVATTKVLVSVPVATATSNSPRCVGQTLNFSGSSSTIYSWAGPNSFSSSTPSPNITNIQNAGAGIYTYTITDSVSCSASTQVSVVVNNLPTITLTNNGPLCEGASLALTANGGSAYSWAGPNGFLSSTKNPTLTNVAAGANGVYTVQVTDLNNCSSISTMNVTVNPKPTITASAVIPNICVSQTINLQSTGGGQYAWAGPNSFTSTSSNPNITNATAVNTGIYTLTVTSVPQGCVSQAQVAVTVNAIPPAPIAANVSRCGTGTLTLTASGCLGVYTWYSTNSSTTALGTGASFVTPSESVDRSYYVDCKEFTCPSSARKKVDLTILPLPTATALSTTQHCKGSTAQFTGGGTNVSSYNWTGPNGFSDPSQSPKRLITSNADGGVYTITATRSNGCTATATTNMTVINNCDNICNGQYVIIPTNPLSCTNTNGQVYIAATNDYQTSLDGVNWFRGNKTFTNLGVGNYFFYVKDYNTQNICKNVSNTLVSVTSNIFTGQTVTSASDCYADNGAIQLQGVLGSDNVTWLATLKTPSVLVSSLSPANTITGLAPGKYYVKVSRANEFCYGERYVDVPNNGTSCISSAFCDDTSAPNLFENGDFGSGTPENGPVLKETQYGYSNYTCYAPWDGFYSITNNTDCDGNGGRAFSNQVVGSWDVLTSDHTPGDVNGYMMVINAGYTPNIVIEKEILNLCPNTQYNFTAWMRNISPDSDIQPNAAFIIDGVIVATSGEVTGSNWKQVGFSFKTGATTNSALFALRNIAPGGFGNNWILDDIKVSKCPLDITLSGVTVACLGSQSEDISATIGDPYQEHVFYKWEKSDDNGSSWQTEVPITQGTYNSGVMNVNVTLPTPIPSALSGRIYRIRLSTTASTIDDPQCSVYTSLTQILVPPMKLVISNDTAKCLGTGAITLSSQITGGDAPYTYTWANGLGNTPSIQVNPTVPTKYIVTAADVNNCPATDTILVDVSYQPSLSVTIDEDSVCLNGAASITAHVIGGSGVFDFTWYSTADTNGTWSIISGEKDSILVLNTNTIGVKFYRVFVEDFVFDCNDAMSNPVMFTIFSNATANVSITDTTFCLGGSMSISAIVTGGTGALTYQWQQSNNGSSPWVDISGETNLNLSIPSSTVGTQYYRYAANSSASGCYIPVSDSAHVRILDVFGVDLSVNNDTVCIGGNVELLADTTNGVGNVGYQWYSSSNGTSFSTISGETNLNYIANTATEGTMYYKVVASSAGVGCGTASSDSAIVKVLPVFDVTVSLENNIVCMGGAVELLADTINGTGNITYQWMQSSDGTNYTNITDSTKVTLHPSTAIDGTKYYKVAATASGSGCGTVVSDSAIVEVLPIFGVDITLSDVIVCQGGLVTLTADTSNGVGDITYQWLSSTDNVNFSPISGETGLTHTANTSSAGTTYYIVEATATGSGCGTVPSASASLEVLPNFAVDIAIDNAVVCIGGGVTISADTTSGTGNITYQWFNSPDGNSFSPLSGENGLTYSAPTSNIGTIYYRVVATASGTGCGTATSDSAAVEVLEVFDVEVTIDNAIVCIGGAVELLADTVNGTGNITYQWLQSSDGSNFTVMTDSTNIAMHPSTAIDGTKYYKVAATASGSGCGTVDSDSAVVKVLPIFGVDIDLTDDVVCIGGAVTLTADTTNGVGDITYQWLSSPNNGTYTEISGETGLTYTPNTSSEGTIYYMVEATATGSGCGTVPSPKVPIQVLPIFDVDIAIDNAIVCEGGSVVITADTINGTGNITYQWYTSADGSSFSPMSGETALSYTPPTGSAGITYYQVTATASGTGCGTVTSDSAIVEVLPQISISIDPGNFSVCTRELVQLDASTQNGVGTFTYQWQSSSDNVNWSNIISASDTLYQPSTALAGIFYYRIIASPDGVGCESDTSASVTVTVYGFPVVSVSKENALCVTDNGEITFTFSNEPNQSEIQLSIDNGVTYPYVVPDNLGTYTVDSLSLGLYHMFARWGDSHCPVDLDTLRITERPPPAALVTYVDPSCTVSNGSITFTFDDNLDRTNLRFSLDSGLTYNPNVPDNSGTVTYDYLAPGTYKLFVMWENGDCPVDLGEVTLTDHPGPILTVSSDTVICYGSNASLLASTTSGDAPITFTWNNGLPNGATQTVSPAVDTYFVVTASDANGCFATDSIFVEVNPLPVVSLTGGEYCEGDDVYLTATGGVSYQWSGPNSYSSTAQNPVILSADTLSRGYFQVLVTDVNYCQTTDSVEVIINAAPSAPILADGFICGPGIVTLTASGCSGVTTWHDNQFNNSVVGLGTTFETTLLGASKNYYVSCTSTSNCVSFDRATAKAEIREISNADVLPINSTCVGDVALNNGILMITGFREGERYSFSEGTTFNSSTAIPASPGLIPVNGRVFGDIQNPTTPNSYYTVRLISTDGCPLDRTVEFLRQCEECFPYCEPAILNKAK